MGGKLSTTASVWLVCRGGEDRVIPSLPVKCKAPSPPTGAGRGDPRVTGAELGPRRGLTPSGFPGSEVERAESERLETGNRGAASAPPTIIACPRWSRRCGVGVAAVRPRVPAPGGTSGAGDRRLLVRATAAVPSRCHHGDAVAPWPAEPAERPGRGAARGRAQAWRRRDQVGDWVPGSRVPRGGAAGTGARRRRASSRSPARTCPRRPGPRPACPLLWPREAAA